MCKNCSCHVCFSIVAGEQIRGGLSRTPQSIAPHPPTHYHPRLLMLYVKVFDVSVETAGEEIWAMVRWWMSVGGANDSRSRTLRPLSLLYYSPWLLLLPRTHVYPRCRVVLVVLLWKNRRTHGREDAGQVDGLLPPSEHRRHLTSTRRTSVAGRRLWPSRQRLVFFYLPPQIKWKIKWPPRKSSPFSLSLTLQPPFYLFFPKNKPENKFLTDVGGNRNQMVRNSFGCCCCF